MEYLSVLREVKKLSLKYTTKYVFEKIKDNFK